MPQEKNIAAFNADAAVQDGYLYTRAKLSSRLANGRISQCVQALCPPKGLRVLDIGSGDGTYSLELLAQGAKEVLGVDAAAMAVRSAQRRAKGRKGIKFSVMDIYSPKTPARRYDLMVLRGVLHHLYDAPRAVAAIAPLVHKILVVEPNGYNPALKIIEKTSPYHIEHEEKSYSPSRLQAWFEAQGAVLKERRYIGLVPMFCPDWMARAFKLIEPLVEALPLLKQLGCAQVVLLFEMPVAARKRKGAR